MTTNAVLSIPTCTGTRKQVSGKSHWLKPLAILCCLVSAVSGGTFGKFTYTDNGTSITITDYPTEEVGAVAIPASIIGKPVTSIGGYAFYSCTRVLESTKSIILSQLFQAAWSSI